MPCVQKLAFALAALTCVVPIALSAQAIMPTMPVNAPKVPPSVTLSGTATWTSGSTKDSGNVTLKVQADGSTEETWNLSKNHHSSKRGSLVGSGDCQETDSDGKSKASEDIGCYRPVTWFSPWIADQLVTDGTAAKLDSTGDLERKLGQTKSTYRLMIPSLPGLNARKAAALKSFVDNTAVDVVYDSVTLLPVRIAYQDHPDSDPGHSIDVDVVFADYRMEGDFNLPHHIQRYVQHALQMDLEVSSVTLN